MNTGLFILSIFLTISLSQARAKKDSNVFNFEIPQWARKEVDKTSFSGLVNKLMTQYHLGGKSNSYPDIIHLLNQGKRTPSINGFSYKDCGGTAGQITKLALTPDPLSFPGVITISAAFTLNTTLSSPLQFKVIFEKKSGSTYIKLPCIANFGSCTYANVCDLLAGVTCPDPLVQYGIPCQCPFVKNNYNLPSASFEVDAAILPEGDYHINAAAFTGGKQAICLDVYVSLTY